MKILFPFIGETIGGSHISAITAVSELRKLSNVEPIIGLHVEGRLCGLLQDRNLSWVTLPNSGLVASRNFRGKKLATGLTLVPSLRKVLTELGVDIVHTHDFRMHPLWSWVTHSTKVMHIFHQRTPNTNTGYWVKIAGDSDALITISEYARSCFPPPLDMKSIILPNPVEDAVEKKNQEISRDVRNALSVPLTATLVGWFANMAKRKRPLDFVRMAEILVQREHNLPLHFVMAGGDKAGIFEEIKHEVRSRGLEQVVHLIGWHDRPQWLMAGMDVTVATSEREAFGRTLVESILAGTPVVASDAGAHPEVLDRGDFGRLYPVGDVSALADTASAALNNHDATMRQVAKAQTVLSLRHSPTTHAHHLKDIYEEILWHS